MNKGYYACTDPAGGGGGGGVGKHKLYMQGSHRFSKTKFHDFSMIFP